MKELSLALIDVMTVSYIDASDEQHGCFQHSYASDYLFVAHFNKTQLFITLFGQ